MQDSLARALDHSEGCTSIAMLVDAHMRMILQINGKHLLGKTDIWKSNDQSVSRLQTRHIAGDGLTGNIKNIYPWRPNAF